MGKWGPRIVLPVVAVAAAGLGFGIAVLVSVKSADPAVQGAIVGAIAGVGGGVVGAAVGAWAALAVAKRTIQDARDARQAEQDEARAARFADRVRELAAQAPESAYAFTTAYDEAMGRAYHNGTVVPMPKVGAAFGQAIRKFHAIGSLIAGRMSQNGTLLSDGRTLVTGGEACGNTCSGVLEAELYDPSTGRFARTGDMNSTHRQSIAALLPNGSVLVAGDGTPGSAEPYDPATGVFSKTGNMLQARVAPMAATLNDGRILVFCGLATASGPTLSSAEIYRP
jgi:gas vesicle protein